MNIQNYFKMDFDKLYLIINDNNQTIELISNKIKKLTDKENIMLLQIKINHLNRNNKNLILKINNTKKKLLLKKFKIIITILNKFLYEKLKDKERDKNEELIFLFLLFSKNKFFEPKVCLNVLNELINKLIFIVENSNLQINKYIIKYN
tara:strand:- start:346 stop:792 length:447 start_codon:yes stop_codon:yes gene_type:complete